MSHAKEDTSRAELAWDEAALGYDAYFGPRFAPFLAATLGALIGRSSELPSPGCIVVPCVGPGRELGPLAHAFSERQIVASDLSGEMVKLARARNARFPNLSVEQDDATKLRAPAQPVAGLFSAFGLQLLPDPPAALESWLRLIEPGGVASVMFWPRESDVNGPFDVMRRLLAESSLLDHGWELRLTATAQAASARVRADVRVRFEMQHDDARSLWQALTRLGPLRGLALARGEAFVDELGARFEAELPAGAMSHTPEARLLVIERT